MIFLGWLQIRACGCPRHDSMPRSLTTKTEVLFSRYPSLVQGVSDPSNMHSPSVHSPLAELDSRITQKSRKMMPNETILSPFPQISAFIISGIKTSQYPHYVCFMRYRNLKLQVIILTVSTFYNSRGLSFPLATSSCFLFQRLKPVCTREVYRTPSVIRPSILPVVRQGKASLRLGMTKSPLGYSSQDLQGTVGDMDCDSVQQSSRLKSYYNFLWDKQIRRPAKKFPSITAFSSWATLQVLE